MFCIKLLNMNCMVFYEGWYCISHVNLWCLSSIKYDFASNDLMRGCILDIKVVFAFLWQINVACITWRLMLPFLSTLRLHVLHKGWFCMHWILWVCLYRIQVILATSVLKWGYIYVLQIILREVYAAEDVTLELQLVISQTQLVHK